MTNANNSILENKVEIDVNIKERLEKILKKIANNLKLLYNKNSNNYSNELIIIIQKELVNIANILKPLKIFRKEYIEFLKIKTILYYILENIDSIDYNHAKRILESIYKFNDLIEFKILAMENVGLEKHYNIELKKFISYIKDLESFFYLDIYETTGEFDDVIIKMSEALLDE